MPTKTEAEAAAEEKKTKPKYERLRKNKQQINSSTISSITSGNEDELSSVNNDVEGLSLKESVDTIIEVKDNWDEESEDEAKVSRNNNDAQGHDENEHDEDDDDDEGDSEDSDDSSDAESSESSEDENDSNLTAVEKIKLRIQV